MGARGVGIAKGDGNRPVTPGKTGTGRVKKLEPVETEAIMMHHLLLELMEQSIKSDQNQVQPGKHFGRKERLEMARKYDWIEPMQRQVIQG